MDGSLYYGTSMVSWRAKTNESKKKYIYKHLGKHVILGDIIGQWVGDGEW
jgi:hypothetical protein